LQTIESERGERVDIEDNVEDDDLTEEAEDEETIPREFNTPKGRHANRLRAIR